MSSSSGTSSITGDGGGAEAEVLQIWLTVSQICGNREKCDSQSSAVQGGSNLYFKLRGLPFEGVMVGDF